MITHSWNGTILTVTSDSGSSSMDLKGEKGDKGCRGPQGCAGISVAADGTIITTGLATEEYVDNAVAVSLEDIDLSAYALKTSIPDVSAYQTEEQVRAIMDEIDLSDYALKSDIPNTENLATKQEVNNLSRDVDSLINLVGDSPVSAQFDNYMYGVFYELKTYGSRSFGGYTLSLDADGTLKLN